MPENVNPVEAALRGGSRAKNYAGQIEKLCRNLPEDPRQIRGEKAAEIVRLASACRASRAVTALLDPEEKPAAVTELVDFFDLFGVMYYPVMEDGKRSVGFWSVKDAATLTPEDVHEWVRDTKPNPKTGKPETVAVGFGAWWKNHRPDYELYGVAGDRAEWRSKTVEVDGRKCVNTAYGKPPVLDRVPEGWGCGDAAAAVLDTVLERVITDPDAGNAKRKRDRFVLDVGAHLLALRDGGGFRCRKLFCFTSTNGGQGTGKSLLQESIAALVPRDASVTVATTELAGQNLLQLYGASVCILTEAPSTATERYTAEDVKAFADAGWKTATEKYVAKRNVRDNSVKLLSSNHLAPLPIDSVRSRRVEFFVAADVDDGGTELRRYLDDVQQKRKWSDVALRQCVGWALLERAQTMLRRGDKPFATARRSIAARHLLSPIDYDYLVNKAGTTEPSYNDYRDYRSDNGVSWSPDRYRFDDIVAMSRSVETWIDDDNAPGPEPEPEQPEDSDGDDSGPLDDRPGETAAPQPERKPAAAKALTLQYKNRMATAYLEGDRIGIAALYAYVSGNADLKTATAAVRDGTADKRRVLRQVFPGAVFDRFSRTDNIVGFTGLTHVDFDRVSENGNGLTPAQVRDALAGMPGFVIGAVSSSGDGVWAIFNAGAAIVDYQTYMAAERSLFDAVDERVCMRCDRALRLPTAGRTVGYDPDCRVADEALAGLLPDPYPWKAPTFAVAAGKLTPTQQNGDATVDERVRNEKFLEAVVDTSCAKIQNAGNGERHDTAIKSVANVVMCCQERGVTPLASWGRRLREACTSCGLGRDETNSIMAYWRQRTGMSA